MNESQIKSLLVFLAKNKLAPMQFYLLLAASRGPVRGADVMRIFETSSATTTNHIDAMEARMLLKRMPIKNDRRSYNLMLTDSGRDMIKKITNTKTK